MALRPPFSAFVAEDFTAETEEEVTVREGEKVTVLECYDDGWWMVRAPNGKEGLCSGDFLDPIQPNMNPPAQPSPQAAPVQRLPTPVAAPTPVSAPASAPTPPSQKTKPTLNVSAVGAAPTGGSGGGGGGGGGAGGWGRVKPNTPRDKKPGLVMVKTSAIGSDGNMKVKPPKSEKLPDVVPDAIKVLRKNRKPRPVTTVNPAALEIFVEAVEEANSKADTSLSEEEMQWVNRVLESSQITHAICVARFFVCKLGESEWTYTKMRGALCVVSESNLVMQCGHFLRLIDIDAFNPNNALFMEQEIYAGMKFVKQSPVFYTFEMDDCVGGLQFVVEKEAQMVAEKVEFCLNHNAKAIITDDLRGKEKAVLLPGGWTRTDEDAGLTKDKLEKYSKGGIMEGTEVKWGKTVPPEIAAALGGGSSGLGGGDAGISGPTEVKKGAMPVTHWQKEQEKSGRRPSDAKMSTGRSERTMSLGGIFKKR